MLGVPPDVLTGLMSMHSGREAAMQTTHDINYGIAAKVSWHGIDLIPVSETEKDRLVGIRTMTEEEVQRVKEWKPLHFNFHVDKARTGGIRGMKADLVIEDEIKEFETSDDLQRKSLIDMHLAGKISDTTLLKEFGLETGERGDDMSENDLDLCCVRGCENEGVHKTIVNGTERALMCDEHMGRLRSKEPNTQELPKRDGLLGVPWPWGPPPGPGLEVKPDYREIELYILNKMQEEEVERRKTDMILAGMDCGSRPAYMEPPSYVNTPGTALYSHYCDRHPEAQQLNPSRSAFICKELDDQVRYRKQTDSCPICDAIKRGEVDPDKVRGHHEHSMTGVRKMLTEKLAAMGCSGSKNQLLVNSLIKRLREIEEENARAVERQVLGRVAGGSNTSIFEMNSVKDIQEIEDEQFIKHCERTINATSEEGRIKRDLEAVKPKLAARGFPTEPIPEPSSISVQPKTSKDPVTEGDLKGKITEETAYYKRRCDEANSYRNSLEFKKSEIARLRAEVEDAEKDRHVGSPSSLNDWLRKPMGSF